MSLADYTPEDYANAIDEWLQRDRLTVSVHPTPERFVSVPLSIEVNDPALYHDICARRAPWVQSLVVTLGHLLYAYWQRGRRR